MSRFEVQSVLPPEEFQSAYGPMYSVKMSGLLDGQVEPNAQINVKDLNKAPQPGHILDVSFTRDNFGVKLKKLPPPPPVAVPAPQPAQNAPQAVPTQAATQYPPREDPQARQGSIERQHSLTAALTYCIAKASYMTKEDALKELTGEHIIRVAVYFKKYSEGKLVLPESTVEDVMGEPLPEYQPTDEEGA